MNSKSVFLSFLALIATINFVRVTDSCIISGESCPCAKTAPSGTCIRYQGNGQCVLSDCAEGYRCDCLAFEACKISQCPKYVSSLGEEESRTVPFQCELKTNGGQCVSFQAVLDTKDASEVAVEQSALFVDEASEAALASAADLALLYTERRQIAVVLAKVDVVAHLISSSSRAAIDEAAMAIDRAVSSAHRELIALHDAAAGALTAYLAVSRGKGDVVRYFQLANEVEEHRVHEQTLSEKENRTCTNCVELEVQIASFHQLSRESAKNASKLAMEARDFKDVAHYHALQMKLKVEEAAQARARGLLEGEKALEDIQTQLGQAS